MFNSCVDYIREMLERAGFTARIGTEHLFVSVHDAVTHAVGIHSDVGLFMSTSMQLPCKFIRAKESVHIQKNSLPQD